MEDTEKRCPECREVKPLTEFYKTPKRCKPCSKEIARKWYVKNREYAMSLNRQWHKDHPERVRAFHAKERARHKHKFRARGILYNAIKKGVIVRGNCYCGKVGEAHHPDYSKPLDVQWLCKKHHEEVHHAAS